MTEGRFVSSSHNRSLVELASRGRNRTLQRIHYRSATSLAMIECPPCRSEQRRMKCLFKLYCFDDDSPLSMTSRLFGGLLQIVSEENVPTPVVVPYQPRKAFCVSLVEDKV